MADEKSGKADSKNQESKEKLETAKGSDQESKKQNPVPADFSVLNLETNESVIVQADMDLDDGWDLLISSGSGNLGPVHASGGSGGTGGCGTATYGK